MLCEPGHLRKEGPTTKDLNVKAPEGTLEDYIKMPFGVLCFKIGVRHKSLQKKCDLKRAQLSIQFRFNPLKEFKL